MMVGLWDLATWPKLSISVNHDIFISVLVRKLQS